MHPLVKGIQVCLNEGRAHFRAVDTLLVAVSQRIAKERLVLKKEEDGIFYQFTLVLNYSAYTVLF